MQIKRTRRKISKKSRAKPGAKTSKAPKRTRTSKPVSSSPIIKETRTDDDKSFAVADAVAEQLQAEGHPMDSNKVMGADFGYDPYTLTNFLNGVRWHLAQRNPPYDFQFDSAFAVQALGLSVGALTGEIDRKTSPPRKAKARATR